MIGRKAGYLAFLGNFAKKSATLILPVTAKNHSSPLPITAHDHQGLP
jgi:hypothetical protein